MVCVMRSAASGLVALCLATSTLAYAQQPGPRDGLSSPAQVERGEVAFRACSYCHGRDLRGGDDPPGPALKGEIFLSKWADGTIGDLFGWIVETMPRDSPGTLELQVYADILAYLLSVNGAPVGTRELTPDAAIFRDTLMPTKTVRSE
jgi:mono/diheme cytochrome c family protein